MKGVPLPEDLRVTRKSTSLDVVEFSRAVGISEKTLVKAEAGNPISPAVIRKFRHYIETQKKAAGNEYKFVPLMSTGPLNGALVRDASAMAIPTLCVDPLAYAFAMPDDSMEPKLIKGSFLTACPSMTPSSGQLCAVKLFHDRLTCRRIQLTSREEITLKPLNAEHESAKVRVKDVEILHPIFDFFSVLADSLPTQPGPVASS